MNGLDEVAGSTGADVGDAGPIAHLGRHLGHQRGNGVVGRAGAAGHHAGPLQGTLGTSGHAHTDVAKALALQLRHTPFGVGVEGVAPIDQQISLFEEGRNLLDHGVDRVARLDHHQDPARFLQLRHKIFEGAGTDDLLASSTTRQKLLGFGVGAVVNDAGEAVALGVEHEVLTHHAKADQTEMGLVHRERYR